MADWVSFNDASSSCASSAIAPEDQKAKEEVPEQPAEQEDPDYLPPPPDAAPKWEDVVAQGDAAAAAGDTEAAMRHYTAALQTCPTQNAAGLHARRSAVLLAKGGKDGIAQALRDAVRCVELQPEWSGGHLSTARAWLAAGHAGKAMAAVERGLAADPLSEELKRVREVLRSGGATVKPKAKKQEGAKAVGEPEKKAVGAAIDESMADGLMSGTFRWAAGKKFCQMPPFPQKQGVELMRGWGKLLGSRDPSGKMIQFAQTDSSLLDCLSFPVTVGFWAQQLGLLRCGGGGCGGGCSAGLGGGSELNIVCLGATSKCEERVLRDTKCWHELGLMFPCVRIKLWMVGPEVSMRPILHPKSVQHLARDLGLPPNMEVRTQRIGPPCFSDFYARHKDELGPHNTLLVTFNGGFGSFVDTGNTELVWSWFDDLCDIADSKIPALFTCANDYADVAGETIIQASLIGARFVQAPTQNPYHSGSTFQGDGGGDDKWFCANHSVYVIQGSIEGARSNIDPSFPTRDAELQSLVRAAKVRGLNNLIGALTKLRLPDKQASPNKDKTADSPSKDSPQKSSPSKGDSSGTQSPEKSTPEKPTSQKSTPEKPTSQKSTPEKPTSQKSTPEKPTSQKSTPEKSTPDKESSEARDGEAVSEEKAVEGSDSEDGTESSGDDECLEIPQWRLEEVDGGYKVTVKLDDVESMGDVDLEVSERVLRVECAGRYEVLEVEWPRQVDKDGCTAKFSKKRRELTVTGLLA